MEDLRDDLGVRDQDLSVGDRSLQE